MKVARLCDYWKGADGYCKRYILITKRYSIDDIKKCGKEIVLFGWFPEAVQVIDALRNNGINVKYVCEVNQVPCSELADEGMDVGHGLILKDYRYFLKNSRNYYFIFFSLDNSADIWKSELVKRVRLLQYTGEDEFGIVSDVRSRDIFGEKLLLDLTYESINEIFSKTTLFDWGAYWLCQTQAGIDIQNWDYLLYKTYEMYKNSSCKSLLEIGPGVGVFSLTLKKLIDVDVTWLMVPDEEAQWSAWRREASLNLYKKYDIKIKEAYVETEDFEGMNDIIVLSQVMEHFVFNPVGTLKKLVNHLIDGGIMLIAVPDIIYNNPPNVESYRDIPYYEDVSVREAQRRMMVNSLTHYHEYSFEEAVDVFNESGLECVAGHTNLPIHHFVLRKKSNA